MQPEKGNSDIRRRALDQWVGDWLGAPVSGEVASADASFRRYFRYRHGGRTLVAMDAPPEQEDCRPFVDVAGRLARAGVAVPEILHQDLEQGFLLLTDMGRETWLTALDGGNADAWFDAALETLITQQRFADTRGLPEYDRALLRRELDLFPHWYLGEHRGLRLDGDTSGRLDAVFETLIESALAQPRVFVHRDFMPRNLMVSDPNPGVIDFQDAVAGPISYDLISLFKDAFLSWPEASVLEWLRDYHRRAAAAGLPVPAAFDDLLRWCDLMGAQRHLKVIGIFARIRHRDGKPKYLEDAPRFFAYLRTVIARRPDELGDLGRLLDLWECP
ncbi:MAG TPA: aminoglycoside phosphotransferase [Alcanivorax sp.]|uniref:aminoglycoside phosphotransferase family protein n=1 Tax=Alloalcanivorax venustensis TaxID=172371 RepID=UPI000C404D7F|nr:aminoglycoside phosphotransferase [Alcanivorax sp.]MBT74354.1 aminoglycoside phosphotransferase [Alcanivorax sp.]HAD46950.1 aminoglycoside phosphotransferase [Alcanivorax sp.]HAI36106.1 aminoglycoside phosphotransferase [Alcanivorax sp.]HBP69480.1 aminoglycoside phosphotransferase [Alcanivorax sp.]